MLYDINVIIIIVATIVPDNFQLKCYSFVYISVRVRCVFHIKFNQVSVFICEIQYKKQEIDQTIFIVKGGNFIRL